MMVKDEDTTNTSNLLTIDEDEELETTPEDIDKITKDLSKQQQQQQASSTTKATTTHSTRKEKEEDNSTSCISFECIIKMLCEDPDKPKENVAENYRSGLAPQYMERGNSAHQQPKAYRMHCLNETGRFAEMDREAEDKWKTQGLPKAYSMRASSCY